MHYLGLISLYIAFDLPFLLFSLGPSPGSNTSVQKG